MQEEVVNDLLCNLDTCKSMGLKPGVLRELAEELSKPLPVIYQQPWSSVDAPGDWKLDNVTLTYRKSQKEVPGKSRPVSLTSVPGKVMEQIHLECHHATCTGQTGDQAQPAGVYKGQVLPDQPSLLL